MTSENSQIVVLRNQQGDIFLIADSVLEAGRVPENKKQAVEQALAGGEVSGYGFGFLGANFNNTTQVMNNIVTQPVINTGINTAVVIGGVLPGSVAQSVTNTGAAVANIGASQSR
jgi:hypothetical protein